MNPIKPNFKTEIFSILLILISILSSLYFYTNFPETVPTHWNVAGEVDAYSSKTVSAFLVPGIIVIFYFVFLFIPYLDPKKERYIEFRKVYHIFKNIILVTLLAIYIITGLSGLGYPVRVDFWVPLLIGILFIVLGNYFGKIKPNWFMGIRTPWTLSSEEVWNKTHRFGGKVFMLGGLLMALMYFINEKYRMFLFAVIISMLLFGTIVYSYIIYLKEKKKNDSTNKQG